MKKGFIILTHSATAEQQSRILAVLPPGVAWFHYLPQSWLIVDRIGTQTAEQLRDRLKPAMGGDVFMVFEVALGAKWAAMATRDQIDWLSSTWNP